MINRILGVLRLDVATFEEIEHDESATTQAAIIVVIAAVLFGARQALSASFATDTIASLTEQFGDVEGFAELASAAPALSPFGLALNAIISTLIGWVLWSYVTYFIGTNMFAGKATPGEMLRVIGFAYAPLFLRLIPCIGWIGWIWSVVASFIGIRQGLDLDNGKTAITVVISLVAVIFINFLIGLILTPIFGLI